MSSNHGLFVKETGTFGGSPIVFIHGGGGALWTWDEVVPLLPDFRCILPDLPEHGQTGLSAGPFSIPGTATLIADLIRQRSPNGKAHVVGLSVGAQIGVEMLAKTPEVMEIGRDQQRSTLSGSRRWVRSLFGKSDGGRLLAGDCAVQTLGRLDPDQHEIFSGYSGAIFQGVPEEFPSDYPRRLGARDGGQFPVPHAGGIE